MWQMITEELTNEDGIHYTAYGFQCGAYTVHDFSSVQSEAESFLRILNDFEVSTIHAKEVIEDHFASL